MKADRIEDEQSESVEGDVLIEEEEILLCAACGNSITANGQRISVDGGHEHTFVNPGGYLFHVGCFKEAPGCLQVGRSTTEFAWFRGSSWKHAVCGSCLENLGWVFHYPSQNRFYGLILDMLISRRGLREGL
jgi:hypothetical protein